MTTVSIDSAVLRSVSVAISRAAIEVAATREAGAAGATALGSDEVAEVLAQVGMEQAVRASVVSESLSSAAVMPSRAAAEFGALDRGMSPL